MVQFTGTEIVIVREENEATFAEKVQRMFDKGYRPAAELKAFADWDEEEKAWHTLYSIALFRQADEATSEYLEGSPLEARRMFG